MSDEGINIALQAITEALNANTQVVSKMIQKSEQEETLKKAAVEAELKKNEQAALIQNIVKAIKDSGEFMLKEDAKEEERKISTEPGDYKHPAQQKPIETSHERTPDAPKKGVILKAEEAEDEEEEEEKEDMKKSDDAVESLKKQVAELTSKLEKALTEQEKQVKVGVDSHLRKMGWKEEKGLAGPIKTVTLGAEEPVNLQKSFNSEEERIAELMKLDYKTLKQLEIANEMDALPSELKQFVS